MTDAATPTPSAHAATSTAGASTAATSTTPVVRIAGVGKTFGTETGGVRALDGIDLAIGQGEFVSLIGPSGCGKSTLLRLIGDLTSPTDGTVEVNGKPARRARLDRDYGMVFQAPVLMEWRTVAKNIELPLELMGYKKAERLRRSSELLKLVELDGFESRHPWQLSGGMQQRVAIARALAFDPKLLLMDEPFGALDEMTRERMNLELMRIWTRTRTTVVFVTHSIPEAVFLSTKVVVMSPRPGRVAKVIDIDLPQPRTVETREQERYFELVTEVREALRRKDGSAPVGDEAMDAALRDAERIRAEGLA
ncbi:MAG TPA: ABC transporter ATP-binding protein [Candidatus Limnocylindrales bacterium]|nr:ABC transporter ATP-binding protein [Candidatus Limnocylindrales bacterium]